MLPRRALLRAAAVTLAGLARAADTRAQPADEWPAREVRIVVPYPAGGTADVIAGVLARELQRALGQPFVVENRAGGGGEVGAKEVARATPDGHTLLIGTVGTHAINTALERPPSFDPLRDFVPVTLLAAVPHVLVMSPAAAQRHDIRSVPDLVRAARANPGRLSMASSGSGTSIHLTGELFKAATGTFMVHVPYRGSGAALLALIEGEMDLMFDALPSALPHIRSGKLKALAVTGSARSPSLPELPTIAEAGGPMLGGFEASTWFGLLAPARTPAEAIERLQAETARVLALPAMRERLLGLDATPGGMSGAAFERYLVNEVRKWAQVARVARASREPASTP